MQDNSIDNEQFEGNILDDEELNEAYSSLRPAGSDSNVPPPDPPKLNLELMKKTNKEARIKYKIPEAPMVKHSILLKAKQRIDFNKQEQKKIPVPPALTMTGLMNAKEQFDRNKKQVTSLEKSSNKRELINAKQSFENQIENQQYPTSSNTKNSSLLMDDDDIQKLKEKLLRARNENKEELIPQTNHHRQPEIQDERAIDHRILPNAEGSKEQNRLYSFDQDYNSQAQSVPRDEVEEIMEEDEEYKPLMPSKTHIMVDDPEIEEVDDLPMRIYSPRFENFDNELNQREEQLEDLKFNKMLVSNIESLEVELKKSHKQINYLEEYNSQLVKSRNDLYEEKEDLIKRSIEFEYIQKRLDDKERRLIELEHENARRNSEIQSLK